MDIYNKRILFSILVLILSMGMLSTSTSASPIDPKTIVSTNQPNQDAWNVDYQGQLGGGAFAVAVKGNYAYVGIGPRVVIVDFSIPSQPFEIGKTQPFPAIVDDIEVVGNYLYIADGQAGLRVVDISIPSDPIEIGFYDTQDAFRIDVSVGYAYIADRSSLVIVNISNPAYPTYVGSYISPRDCWDVVVMGSLAYVIDYFQGLRIVNISNPYSPIEVSSYVPGGYTYGLTVVDQYAYLVNEYDGLRIVDISNPFNPHEVGICDTPGFAMDVTIIGDYAYIADGFAGLRVINISYKTHPVEIGHNDDPKDAFNVVAYGDYAYIVDWPFGLRSIDISNPSNPVSVSRYIQQGLGEDVVIKDNYAYIASDSADLSIVDIANILKPVVVSHYFAEGFTLDVTVINNNAFIVSDLSGMYIVNISDPYNPIGISQYDTPGDAIGIKVVGNYAYIADGDAGLNIADISNLSNPTYISVFNPPGTVEAVDVSNGYAYLAVSGGLRIVDVTDPYHPIETGFCNLQATGVGVSISGNYAYVTGSYSGLFVIDISGKNNPIEISHIDTPGTAIDVTLSNNYAYVADFMSGVRVINIEDPHNIFEAGYYDTVDSARGTAVIDRYIYVADGNGGVATLQFTDPVADIKFRSFPNGYNFPNFTGRNPDDFTIPDMQRVFGIENVCWIQQPNCIPIFFAKLWYEKFSRDLESGHCYGMAVTSLRFFKDIDTHPSAQSVFGLREGSTVSINWNMENFNSTVRRNISYFFVSQFPDPVRSTINDALNYTPTEVKDQLIASMESGASDPVILLMSNANSAHAITPYEISTPSNGIFWVWVYDNNYPADANRYVIIDTNTNTWSYDLGWETWNGDADTNNLGVAPISVHDQQLQCPWCIGFTENSLANNTLLLDGKGHLLITDSQGRYLGFIDDQYVEEIPGGYGSIPFLGTQVEREPIYTLPLTETYTILLDGQAITQTSSGSITQFGPGYAISVDDLDVNPSTQDHLFVANDGTQISYSPNQDQEPTFSIGLDSLSANYGFEFRGTDIKVGEVITFTADMDSGNLIFNNSQASSSIYSLFIRMVSDIGLDYFYHQDIPILATDTQIINFGPWNGSGSILLMIDHGSDGTIDETIHLDNQMKFAFLPIVRLNR
jgi:hypothetical protein